MMSLMQSSMSNGVLVLGVRFSCVAAKEVALRFRGSGLRELFHCRPCSSFWVDGYWRLSRGEGEG